MPDLEDASYDYQPYESGDHCHSQCSTIRVIQVGAGAAGLCMAYKMKNLFDDYELCVYEKNAGIGGTWFENRYPGCACDVPAHIYTYSFEPNPNWSSFYAAAPEIQRYFENFANKYDLHKHIALNSKVISATWDEGQGIWEVEVDVNGTRKKDWSHVLVNGTGFVNDWKWPAIDGLHSFKGPLIHSAAWDPKIELTGKKVGIIGTGSSAIQCVPQIQKQAKHLTSFMRSATWISPPFGGSVMEAHKGTKANEDQERAAETGALQEQHVYTQEEIERFNEDPEYLLEYRRGLEAGMSGSFATFLPGSEGSRMAKQYMTELMERRIGPGHEELKKKMIPTWLPGCRRLTPGDGYLEALVKPNVTTVFDDIVKVVPEGLTDESGKLHEVDVLICATGFNIAFAPTFEVYGTNSARIKEEFDPEPQVYLSMTAPKFPNYFIVNGVRGGWAAGVALPSHEVCVEYICKCIKKIQEEGLLALEVRQEPVTQLYEHIDAWHKHSVWNQDCKSWYKNNVRGGKLWIWGGSGLHHMKTIKEVKWEHYDHRYRSRNMWTYLGNGMTKAQAQPGVDKVKLAPYIRNSDTPWELD